ncbi:hypothetical protein [Novosphingobium sp.]|uniref:Pam3-gp28 family putative phage holin n=1 Tax=Novosphingobium sp. TaxID=1874826 RepID=UPI0038B9D318
MDPIEVNGSPIGEQLWSGVRTVAVAGGAFALGRGYIAQDTLALLAAIGAVAWGVIAAQMKTWQRSHKLVKLAQAVSDDVAVIK